MSRIRIGIDVGGTFTHAVAIDNSTLEILDFAVTPTTHGAAEGVARGVVDVFVLLLEKLAKRNYSRRDIVFVAHSTTQATNALLEGDVCNVAIVALGEGLEGVKAKADANIPDIEIAPKRFIHTKFYFLDTSSDWKEPLENILDGAVRENIGAVAAAEPFSVDDSSHELYVKERASEKGLAACGSFEMSGLYGLRVRTKTAVINASILPKMMETAEMTRDSLLKASVDAPLMVMRSDGGVMSVAEMMRRPLLTLLSGPAAGIAAALTYIRATDAIFLETGGTSTDITVIKDGRAAIRSASIGGHTTYLKTLDCRTLGIAGGSMVQTSGGKIMAAGPRSAHIAGLAYSCFSELGGGALAVKTVSPLKGDPEYLVVENEEGVRFAVTTTCAANFLGYISQGDYAFGKKSNGEKVFAALGEYFSVKPEEAASRILELAVDVVEKTVRQLIKEYGLGEKQVRLIGGGGGCFAVVPPLARRMGLDFETARHAEVVSAIGAAMAMVRETVEKNIFSPTPSDVEAVKREAVVAVVAMGASEDSIEVYVEVDSQKNIVRAIATGSIEFKSQDLLETDIGEEGRRKILTQMFAGGEPQIHQEASTGHLFIYRVDTVKKMFLNLIRTRKSTAVVCDAKAAVKLQIPGGRVYGFKAAEGASQIENILERHRQYGDAGALTGGLYLAAGRRIADFTSIGEESQIAALVRKELEAYDRDEPVAFIVP